MFRATYGSKAWDRIIRAWPKMSPHLAVRPPVNDCEVLTTRLWWSSFYIGGQFGFSHASAAQLMRNGLQQIGDLWDPHTISFLPWYEAGIRYGFHPRDRQCYINMVASIPQSWQELLLDKYRASKSKKYLGLFDSDDAELPGIIFTTSRNFRLLLELGECQFTILNSIMQFYLDSISKLLLPWPVQDPASKVTYAAHIKRTQVITTTKGTRFYIGITQ